MQYFAGANTKNGFVSFFDKTFLDVERLYIIKGSCGCGKSTLMRKIADLAESRGLAVHRIYCSGDPKSLDGVIVPESGFGICDGTAPHLADVKYPCVRESIVNIGEFLKPSVLMPHREEIISLTDKKSALYSSAYRALAAAGKLKDISYSIALSRIDQDGLSRFASRLVHRYAPAEVSGTRQTLLASAFTSSGLVTLPTFGHVDTLIRVSGGRSIGKLFMNYVNQESLSAGNHIVSLSATDPDAVDSVFFPHSGVLFTSLSHAPCEKANNEKTLNLSRFIDKSDNSPSKGRERLLERLADESEKQAVADLQQASELHQRLEEIYIAGMDFKALDKYSGELIKRLLG